MGCRQFGCCICVFMSAAICVHNCLLLITERLYETHTRTHTHIHNEGQNWQYIAHKMRYIIKSKCRSSAAHAGTLIQCRWKWQVCGNLAALKVGEHENDHFQWASHTLICRFAVGTYAYVSAERFGSPNARMFCSLCVCSVRRQGNDLSFEITGTKNLNEYEVCHCLSFKL